MSSQQKISSTKYNRSENENAAPLRGPLWFERAFFWIAAAMRYDPLTRDEIVSRLSRYASGATGENN